jgi:hypothetical protein
MRVFLLIGTLLLAGCTFVQLSDAGAGVAQLGGGDVANCESKGVVSTQTRAKVVVSRSEEAVREELTVMARNEAAKLGANAIVPIARPEDGAQSFRAFLCN